MSEHNPLRPDIQFFSNNSESGRAAGSAEFKGASDGKLVLQSGDERATHITSKDMDYWFDLPASTASGTGSTVMWKRVQNGGGGTPVTEKGNRALVYELQDQEVGEPLAIYDESEEGKTNLLQKAKLVLSPELQANEDQRLSVLMGALSICEETRRRAGKARSGIGSSANVRVL